MELPEIMERAVSDAERCVRDSQAIDYAYVTGNLKAFIDTEYAELIGDTNGDTNDGSAEP